MRPRRCHVPGTLNLVLWCLVAAIVVSLGANFALVRKLPRTHDHAPRTRSRTNLTAGATAPRVPSPRAAGGAGTAGDARHPTRDDDRRPWLILHVGPPKTGTSTVRAGLFRHAKRLAEDDNFHFLGAGPKPRSTVAVEGGARKLTVLGIWKFPWYRKDEDDVFLKELEEHRRRGRHVVVSSEQLAQMVAGYDDVIADICRTASGFRFKIVVSYRHLFEWLPSQYFQSNVVRPRPEKIDAYYNPGLLSYVEEYLERLVQYDPADERTTIASTADFHGKHKFNGGFRQEDNSDRWWRNATQETSHASVWAYLRYSARPALYERVDIFDMHQQQLSGAPGPPRDLFAEFVCQSLPSAAKTCQHLREAADPPIFERSSDTYTEGGVTVMDLNRILAAVYRVPGFARWNTTAPEFLPRVKQWFNLTAHPPAAARRCLSPAHAGRLKMASWHALLQMALLARSHRRSRRRRDAAYHAALFRSSVPTRRLLLSAQRAADDDDAGEAWRAPARAAHDAAFEAFAAAGKLCELHVERLLDDKEFMQFVFFRDG